MTMVLRAILEDRIFFGGNWLMDNNNVKCYFIRWHALICRSPQIGWLVWIKSTNLIVFRWKAHSNIQISPHLVPCSLFYPLPCLHCKWTAMPWSPDGGGQVINCIRHSNVRASALLCSFVLLYTCAILHAARTYLYFDKVIPSCMLRKSPLVLLFCQDWFSLHHIGPRVIVVVLN